VACERVKPTYYKHSNIIFTNIQLTQLAHSYTQGDFWLFMYFSVQCVEVKMLGHGTDYPPPSSAEVKEGVELYLYPPLGLHWLFQGWTLPLLSIHVINQKCQPCHIYIVKPLVPLLISPNDIPEIVLKIKNCRREVIMQIHMTYKIQCTWTVKNCFNF